MRGFAIVTRPGVRIYVVAPLLINVVLFTTLLWFGASWLVDFARDMLPDWLDFLAWLLVPAFVIAALMAGFYSFNLVANFIAAPFNGLLAAAVERHLTGRSPPSADGGWRTFFADLATTLLAEIRKLVSPWQFAPCRHWRCSSYRESTWWRRSYGWWWAPGCSSLPTSTIPWRNHGIRFRRTADAECGTGVCWESDSAVR